MSGESRYNTRLIENKKEVKLVSCITALLLKDT